MFSFVQILHYRVLVRLILKFSLVHIMTCAALQQITTFAMSKIDNFIYIHHIYAIHIHACRLIVLSHDRVRHHLSGPQRSGTLGLPSSIDENASL